MSYKIVNPFSALREFQQALDSAHLSDWFGQRTSGPGSFPAINVFAKDDDCVLVAELPGVDKSLIDISVKGNQVTIKGQKHIKYEDKVSVHRRERDSGEFDRTLSMPIEINPDNVKADYKDGVLAIFLPRAEVDKPKSVTIN